MFLWSFRKQLSPIPPYSPFDLLHVFLVVSLMSLTVSLMTTSRMQQCFNVMWILVFTKCFSIPVSLLYSVGNKTYYYYLPHMTLAFTVFLCIMHMFLLKVQFEYISVTSQGTHSFSNSGGLDYCSKACSGQHQISHYLFITKGASNAYNVPMTWRHHETQRAPRPTVDTPHLYRSCTNRNSNQVREITYNFIFNIC